MEPDFIKSFRIKQTAIKNDNVRISLHRNAYLNGRKIDTAHRTSSDLQKMNKKILNPGC